MLRMKSRGPLAVLVAGVGLLGAVQGRAQAQSRAGEGRLELVEAVPRDDLDGTVSAAISPDGKFLYSSAWKAASLTVFARDGQSGRLEHRQTITSEDLLGGATALSLGPDGRFAIATAFQSRAVVLYRRDAETGELSQSDSAREGEPGVRFRWPIDAAFSPDGKFAYVLDDRGPGEQGRGALVAFRIRGGKLEHVADDEGQDGCYDGARGLALRPDGKTLLVASYRAGAVVVADRDEADGTTTVRQVVKDEPGQAPSLAGAMGVAVSPDGRHAYVSAGRFSGVGAVSGFKFDADGRLEPLQGFRNGDGTLDDFEGGNEIAVSRDGLNVYAVATRSGTVASFRRDPASGLLRSPRTLPDGGDTPGGSRAAGLGISPDGRFVYVATEDGKAISVFKREPPARDP